MTRDEFLTSTDPAAMLAWLQGGYRHKATGILSGTVVNEPRRITDRQLRLFAVACCRAVWDRLVDPRSRRAVEVAELYADGLATEEELWLADRGAIIQRDGIHDVALFVADKTVGECASKTSHYAAKYGAMPATQAALLRTIIGDPFDPVTLDQHWLTPDVLAIASRIYDTRDWDAMPMLADALQDAGCEDARVLEWLRGDVGCSVCNSGLLFVGILGEAHVCKVCSGTGRIKPMRCRGDWCLDLILGKE